MYYIAGITLSVFLSLLLFTKKNNGLADRILACWLLVIAFHLYLFYAFISGNIYDTPFLLGTHFPLPLLHGPFLYLYASALTGNLYQLKPKHLLHFLPALLSYVYLIGYFILPPQQKIEVFRNKGEGYEAFMVTNAVAIILSGIIYVVLTTMLHRKHKRNILQQFSDTEKITLDWIQYLICGIGLIWIFVILNKDAFVFGTAVLFILFIGYFGIRQVGIFTHGPGIPDNKQIPPVQKETAAVVDELLVVSSGEKNPEKSTDVFTIQDHENTAAFKKKYSKSGLTTEGALQLHEGLKKIVKEEKVYKKGDLTLSELAKKLGTHPNYLSQVINEKEKKNFYDYINDLRTEEFKNLVADPANRKFTLLSLAFECGFNSKSSFNKYFKKMTGLSPTEYLQQMKIDVAA